MIYFITGASGVGKTTLINNLKAEYSNEDSIFLHFDSIGVPTVEEMIREFGSPSEWQKAMTYKWIEKLINEYDKELIFFEGQVNLDFIKEGFNKFDFKNYKVILVDCNEEKMSQRLKNRNQLELFTEDMKNWLRFLRNQAKETGVLILDTTEMRKEEVVVEFKKIAGLDKRNK